MAFLPFIVTVYYLAFGNLSMVLKQRVQIFTLRRTPLIVIRRRCTFNTKRRRVRFCEKLTLLPYIGLRSHISQRPDIYLFLSISFKGLV